MQCIDPFVRCTHKVVHMNAYKQLLRERRCSRQVPWWSPGEAVVEGLNFHPQSHRSHSSVRELGWRELLPYV